MAKIWEVSFDMPYTHTEEYRERNEQKIADFIEHVREVTGKLLGQLSGHSRVSVLADEKQLFAFYLAYAQNDYNGVRITKVDMALETPVLDDPLEQLVPMLERIELAASRVERMKESGDYYGKWNQLPDGLAAAGWNQLVGSPVPGAQLLTINRLMLKEDCCTDELQRHLSDGWRLLAVCPQESRRPDYVLGKYDPGYIAEVAER